MTDPYAALQVALEALEAVEPHSEAVMCYASTINEWPANAIPAQLNRAITAARAALEAKPEPVATLHDDGCFTWKRDEFRRKYDRQRAGWRMDVYAGPDKKAD